MEALEAEAKALEARAAAVEGASAGAAGVRGLARRARNAVAPLLLTSAPDCLAELLERFFDCHLARFNAERRPDDVANEQSYDEEGDDGDGKAWRNAPRSGLATFDHASHFALLSLN